MAAGSADGVVRVWRAATLAPVASLPCPGPVVALAWLGDTLVALAGAAVCVWTAVGGGGGDFEPAPGLALGAVPALGAALAGGPDGDTTILALGHTDGSVSVWERRGGPASAFAVAARAGGHRDWVRAVALRASTAGLLLASASNDCTARVWRLESAAAAQPPPPGSDAALDAAVAALAAPAATGASLNLVAVLGGHSDWVASVEWVAEEDEGNGADAADTRSSSPPRLLTVSADASARLWSPSSDDPDVWLDTDAVGDAGAGAAAGFSAGCARAGGGSIAAVGHRGALHVWHRDASSGAWKAAPAAGGHAGAVVDVGWTGADGAVLLTASTDMTTRLHARLHASLGGGGWAEVGRPQAHGHALSAVAPLPPPALAYASASEEKVVRVYAAPAAVAESLALGAGASAEAARAAGAAAPGAAYGAAVPALGLSNKALHAPTTEDGGDGATHDPSPDGLPPAAPAALAGRATHAHLAAATLWPEVAKLYGHGSEVVAAAASPSGRLVATAAAARAAAHAAVRLWRPPAWAEASEPIVCHSLTVTALAFDGSGGRLVTASRDRSWALHRVSDPDPAAPATVATLHHHAAAHARALTAVAWAPGGACFATAGRDGCVRLWGVGAGDAVSPPIDLPTFGEAVTALAYAPGAGGGPPTLAVGTARGGVQLWATALDPALPPSLLWAAAPGAAHAGAVRRLAWAPAPWPDGAARLASAGDDGAARVFAVRV